MSSHHSQITAQNLLLDKQFISFVQFQSNYANSVKGGHLPYYYTQDHRHRLVANVNLLGAKEMQNLVYETFVSKN
jgi:hypothetical protein